MPMSTEPRNDEAVVWWLDLVLPRRSLQRRVRRNAHMDAMRAVDSPSTIGEIAAWEAGTLRALSSRVHTVVGPHNARVDSLRARLAALGPAPESRPVMTDHLPPSAVVDPGPVGASHPLAQARRRARLEAGQRAVVEADRSVLQAELAEAEALRAAAVDTVRENARQCHESSLGLQHLYWGVRRRWTRRRHGPPPSPRFVDAPLPDWVTTPGVLYGRQQHGGAT
jgi:hypothetical protein